MMIDAINKLIQEFHYPKVKHLSGSNSLHTLSHFVWVYLDVYANWKGLLAVISLSQKMLSMFKKTLTPSPMGFDFRFVNLIYEAFMLLEFDPCTQCIKKKN